MNSLPESASSLQYSCFTAFQSKIRSSLSLIESKLEEQADEHKFSSKQDSAYLKLFRLNFHLKELPSIDTIHQTFIQINKKRIFKTKWLNDEIILLIWSVFYQMKLSNKKPEEFNSTLWIEISNLFKERPWKQCMFKYFNLLRSNPIKRSAKWTKEEDDILFKITKRYFENHCQFKWSRIAQELFEKSGGFILRLGKHCRERWNNHLNPELNKGKWNSEEDLNLIQNILEKGKKWANISKLIKGRNEYSVKNRFYFIMKKNHINPNSRNFNNELKNLISIYTKKEETIKKTKIIKKVKKFQLKKEIIKRRKEKRNIGASELIKEKIKIEEEKKQVNTPTTQKYSANIDENLNLNDNNFVNSLINLQNFQNFMRTMYYQQILRQSIMNPYNQLLLNQIMHLNN